MSAALALIKRIHARGGRRVDFTDLTLYLRPAERRRINLARSRIEREHVFMALRPELLRRQAEVGAAIDQLRTRARAASALYLPDRPIGMYVTGPAHAPRFGEVDEQGNPKRGRPSEKMPLERWLEEREKSFRARVQGCVPEPAPRLADLGNAEKTKQAERHAGAVLEARRRLMARKRPPAAHRLRPKLVELTGCSYSTVTRILIEAGYIRPRTRKKSPNPSG